MILPISAEDRVRAVSPNCVSPHRDAPRGRLQEVVNEKTKSDFIKLPDLSTPHEPLHAQEAHIWGAYAKQHKGK
jgi:hypothetical protein